jgi:hypothetical protein
LGQRDPKAFRANGHARPDTGIPVTGGGPSPLQVLLSVMRRYLEAGDLAAAAAVAKDAAVYCHARLSCAVAGEGPGPNVNFANRGGHETGRADR